MAFEKVQIGDSVTLYRGDCLEVLPTLDGGSVESCISDPPYGVKYADWDGNTPSQETLSNCLRISSGPVVWFGAMSVVLEFGRYTPQPDRMLVWSPAFSLSQTGRNGMHYRCHPIWCWRLPSSQKVISKDLLTHNCEGRHWWDHPATKPVKLMDDLVAAFGGASVLDCYMGSGTTGVAAVRSGKCFVGIEREPKYFDIACKRITDELAAAPLFDEQVTPTQRELIS